MNYVNSVGAYAIMLKSVFKKPQKRKIFWEAVFREVDDLGVKSIGIVAFISFFIGGVVAIQTALNLEDPIIPKDLIGFATKRSMILEFSSTFIMVILAGKVGSYITSSIGTMRVTEQIDALEVMGINSLNYLVLPKITWPIIVFALLSATLIRIIPVMLSLQFTNLKFKERLTFAWFGPRGLASIVFTLMVIDTNIENKYQIATIAMTTILFSVFIHGMTTKPIADSFSKRN